MHNNIFNLEGKNALVTGGNGAIGEAIIKALVAQGAHVFVAGSANGSDALASIQQQIDNIAGVIAIDITADGATDQIFEQALTALPGNRIDILINCAGIAMDNLFIRISDEEWDKQFNVNVRSAWKLTKVTLLHMIKNHWGRVISISSVIGKLGNPGQTVYAATKEAICGMTRSLAREVAARGVTVNCVSPGFIESAMTQKLLSKTDLFNKIIGNIPAGKVGQPEDVAAAVVYLASPAASYLTGVDLPVCGGMYMN